VFLGKLFPDLGLSGKILREHLRTEFIKRVSDIFYQNEINAIVICGNLFGTNMFSVKDYQATRDLFDTLDIPVFILPGQLDEFNDVSIYSKLEYNEKVQILKKNFLEYSFNNQEVSIVLLSDNVKEEIKTNPNNFYIFCQNNPNHQIEGDKVFTLGASEIEFVSGKNLICVPPFDFSVIREQKESGVGILSIKEGNFSYRKIEGNYFRHHNLTIDVTGRGKTFIQNILNDYYGENTIVNMVLKGEINTPEILDYVTGFYERERKNFLFMSLQDETVISEEYIERIPNYLESGIFIKHVKKSFDKNKIEVEKEILKSGINFYEG